MTVGLPGVGIGGIFYLVSALLMPVRSLAATLSGRAHEARWPLALRQASLAAVILSALWITGWALGLLMATVTPVVAVTAGGTGAPVQVNNVVRTTALLMSFGTLAVVLTLVQVLRLTLSVRATARNDAGVPQRSARPAA